MPQLRATAIVLAAFFAGASLAEVGVRVTGAYRHDRSRIEALSPAGRRPVPVRPARSVEPPPQPRCPALAI